MTWTHDTRYQLYLWWKHCQWYFIWWAFNFSNFYMSPELIVVFFCVCVCVWIVITYYLLVAWIQNFSQVKWFTPYPLDIFWHLKYSSYMSIQYFSFYHFHLKYIYFYHNHISFFADILKLLSFLFTLLEKIVYKSV